MVELKTQPSQSPDLNVDDMGVLASLKSRVWRANAISVDELVKSFFDLYEENDGDTFERGWQNLLKVYNQTLRKLGDNDILRVEHVGVKAWQRAGMLQRVVKNDAEAFSAAWDYLASSDGEDFIYFFQVFFARGKGAKYGLFSADYFFSGRWPMQEAARKKNKNGFQLKK